MTSLKSDLILSAALALALAGPAWSATAAGATTSAPAKKSSVKHASATKAVAKKTLAKKDVAKKPAASVAAQPETGTTLTAEVTTLAAAATAAVAAPIVVASVSENAGVPSSAAPAAPASTNPYLAYVSKDQGNPYLAAGPAAPVGSRSLGADLRALLPSLPGDGQSFLPSIKKVYPTGEKPLVVITFKCPTELVGVTPPPVKLLHSAVDGSFQALNATDWLSFDLQQVCQ